MKLKLTVITMTLALFLFSCEKKEDEAQPEAQPQRGVQATQVQPAQPAAPTHTGVVQEVLQATAYTYLKIKENDTESWIAIPKRESEVGETVSFVQGLEMKDFPSKDLDRTFASVYFVNGVSNQAPGAEEDTQTALMSHHQKPAAEKLDITIEPVTGGLSLADLFANRDEHADKAVTVKGKVTKVNRAIMGKNWIHLQDGTGDATNYDLTITTQDEVNVDDVVAFTGTITLNKDFGAGYKYDIIMEDAKQLKEE
jgi:hypothetical protein